MVSTHKNANQVILEPWDWRYVIGKDSALKNNIQKQIDLVSDSSTRDLYQKLFAFFSNIDYSNCASKNLNLYLEIVLNADQLNFIKNYKTNDIYLCTPSKKYLSSTDMEAYALEYSEKLIEDYGLNCKVELSQSSDGFAEYWPTLLTNDSTDKLIIYRNKDSSELHNLALTIEHEVVGHGQFYQFLKAVSPDFIDHGCVLIEGWPTYVEWQNLHNPRSAFNKDFLIRVLQAKINGNLTEIEKLSKHAGYSEESLKSSMNMFSTMVGFAESYAIGALLIEKKYKNSFTADSLKDLIIKGCGDHLLWDFI